MYQVQQRIAVLTQSRARLLAELRELDLLREQVRKWQLGACAGDFQKSPSKDPQNCADPGPAGFEFSEEVVAHLDDNSDAPLLLNRDEEAHPSSTSTQSIKDVRSLLDGRERRRLSMFTVKLAAK